MKYNWVTRLIPIILETLQLEYLLFCARIHIFHVHSLFNFFVVICSHPLREPS